LADTANMIKVIAVSGLASLFAYGINRWMVGKLGDRAVKLLVPIGEEGLKTGFALVFRVSVPITHLGFGVYEAIYDISANPGVDRGKRWLAALLALLGHTLFGWLTWFIIDLGWASILAILLVGIVHGCWNMVALQK